MDEWTEIRRRVLVDGVSRRQIQRETGLHWKTLKKVLEHSEPPGYRQEKARPKRKLGPHEAWIGQVLFRWKDRAQGDAPRVESVSGVEFVTRYLRHVLPKGMRAVLQYGGGFFSVKVLE